MNLCILKVSIHSISFLCYLLDRISKLLHLYFEVTGFGIDQFFIFQLYLEVIYLIFQSFNIFCVDKKLLVLFIVVFLLPCSQFLLKVSDSSLGIGQTFNNFILLFCHPCQLIFQIGNLFILLSRLLIDLCLQLLDLCLKSFNNLLLFIIIGSSILIFQSLNLGLQ